MNLKGLFKSKLKQPIIVHVPVGTVIPVDDLNTQVIVDAPIPNAIEAPVFYPPCPVQLMMICVCCQCKHIKTCPMEKMCRMEDCNVFIRACQNYTNEQDKAADDKRIIFKSGGQWDGTTFHFKPKEK
jgi:hypothetical protein